MILTPPIQIISAALLALPQAFAFAFALQALKPNNKVAAFLKPLLNNKQLDLQW